VRVNDGGVNPLRQLTLGKLRKGPGESSPAGDILLLFPTTDSVKAVFVNKDVRSIIQAAFGSYDRSACNSFGGFSQTSETGSQFRVLPDQRAGLRFFAAS